jgi:hypothetical protein
MVQAVGIVLLVSLYRALVRGSTADTSGAVAARLAENIDAAAQRLGRAVNWPGVLFDALVSTPALMLRDHPWATLLVLPLGAVWVTLLGGAISRSAACDHAQGVAISWPQALGFALSRWGSLALSLTLPLVVVWAIVFALAVGGAALFSLPGVNVLGGLLWGLFLVGGLVAALVLGAFFFGHPLLVPSVACEATDAVDAFQHAYSFVFARPPRLVLYTLLLVAQGAVLMAVVGGVAWLGVHAAQAAALQWSGERGAAVLGVLPGNHPPLGVEPALTGPARAAHALANFWTLLVGVVLPAGVLVSYVWSASTVLYLAMRRIVDGQDVGEIWMPGMAEGVLAPAVPPAPPPPARASESVSDTGPADET